MNNGVRQLTEQDIQTLSTTKQVEFGAIGETPDGRRFRYVGFGGTSTVAPGLLMQTPPLTANYQALAITAAGTGGQVTANLAAGSNTLVLTNGATAVTQDQFAEGFLNVVQTSGSSNGPIGYQIRGNSAAAATTGYIQVILAEPLRNASVLVAGTDTASLALSPYSGVQATTTVNVPVGVNINQAVNSSTVTNYGWVQSKGEVMAFLDASAVVIGNTVGPSTTTAGYIGLAVTTTKAPVGWSQVTTSSTAGGNPIVINCI